MRAAESSGRGRKCGLMYRIANRERRAQYDRDRKRRTAEGT